ncbi:MAG TPA: TIGR00730 family Rossman fold protein, partial [Acidimicrobiales bacterium]|nr:TIGR00730 family Rossman fold protein [Acidimicrobiales bacterium]
TMHERKALMYDLADTLVAFPGGFGTLDETFEAITWSALGIHAKPVGFLEVDGFWGPLIDWLHHAVDVGVISERRRDLLVLDHDPDRLLDRLASMRPTGEAVITPDER